MDKNQTTTKKDDAMYAKVWALSERYERVTHSRAPLDSTAIYPKPGLPTLQETGKIETLSRSYLCLEHPTWAWCRRSCHLQDGTPFLFALARTCLMKTCKMLPHTPWGNLFFELVFIIPWAWGWQASSMRSSRDGASWARPSSSLLEVDPSWCNSLHMSWSTFKLLLSSWFQWAQSPWTFLHLPTLRPTHGPSDANGQTYKWNSIYTLVHRDCH